MGKAQGGRGHCCSKGLQGKPYQELTFAVTLDCCLGQVLMGLTGVSSRSLQATWPHRMDAEAAILWSSLANL